jgi:protein-tyrosine-phosphatase
MNPPDPIQLTKEHIIMLQDMKNEVPCDDPHYKKQYLQTIDDMIDKAQKFLEQLEKE